MLNGKENKTVRIWSEKRFGGKESFVLEVLCFDGGLRGEAGVVGFRAVRVVLTQNSFQSSPLSRMKLVILRKAWYVTACCWRGMVLGWGEILVVVEEVGLELKC